MSDDEDYYDDDDYFFIDDEPVAEAVRAVQGNWELRPSLIRGNAATRSNFLLIFWPQDDLAEHTIYSPVLRDHDPSDELIEYWSDWEYYSDDYYDEAPAPSKRDVISNGEKSRQTGGKRKSIANNGGRRKRRKQDSAEDIRGQSFGDRAGSEDRETRSITPIVLWRSKEDAKNEPVTHQGNGEMVALLKNWKELFGTHSDDGEIGRNTDLPKHGPGQSIDTQSCIDGYRFMTTRVQRVTKPNASPPSRRDLPDNNNSNSPKNQLQAT